MKPARRIRLRRGSVIVLAMTLFATACAHLASIAPAGAQFFFEDRYPFLERRRQQQRQYYYRDWPSQDWPFQQRYRETPRQQPVDSSKAPAPTRKPDPAAKSVIVLGDSMADWLAYGLEEAFSETPDVSVVRKHRTVSGLIRNESRPDSFDWLQSARDILAAEKASFVVMMIGTADRQAIRERRAPPASAQRPPSPAGSQGPQASPRAAAPPGPSAATNPPAANPPSVPPPAGSPPAGSQPQQQAAAESSGPAARDGPAQAKSEDTPAADTPSIVAPEQGRGGTLTHEFRSERWAELYAKRIDDVIAVLKSKGVPVYWVGLPAVRGTRSTSEVAYLNDLFRARAERAGIVYVDVWDGFVDEAGNFAVQGPDVDGQIRRLRTGDGVHFSKFGARKLAHYVEREIQRSLAARPMTVSLPEPEEPLPQTPGAKPAVPAARAPAGPIVYLTGNPKGGEGLLGGAAPGRSALTDPVATQVLVKGETVPAPAGRADDFSWPRRPIATTSVTNIQEPETPPAPGSAEARAAGSQNAANGPQAQRPPQKTAQPKQPAPPPARSPSFFPFWPWGR